MAKRKTEKPVIVNRQEAIRVATDWIQELGVEVTSETTTGERHVPFVKDGRRRSVKTTVTYVKLILR